MEFAMRRNALVIVFLIALVLPAVAQKAQIEAVNAKWMELFNKGDFEGLAQLYTVDAIAFPPGSAMVRGRAAIGTMRKGVAEQVSNPKVTTPRSQAVGPFGST
jgi:ketosteroid isomerase-like protein